MSIIFHVLLFLRSQSACDDTSSELQRVAALEPRDEPSRNSFRGRGALSRFSTQTYAQTCPLKYSSPDLTKSFWLLHQIGESGGHSERLGTQKSDRGGGETRFLPGEISRT